MRTKHLNAGMIIILRLFDVIEMLGAVSASPDFSVAVLVPRWCFGDPHRIEVVFEILVPRTSPRQAIGQAM